MNHGHWEHFEHPADMGIRGMGPTREQAFAQAALALTAVMVDPKTIDPVTAVITDEEPDDDLLLVTFLNDVLYEMATRRMIFGRFDVTINDHQLTATLRGEPLDQDKHTPGTEVKAATYAQLKVEQRADNSWIAQCVVDV